MHTVQLKPTIKAKISGRMASIGISDVVTASVYSEKTRLKKLMMIIIMNKSQETTVFSGPPKCFFVASLIWERVATQAGGGKKSLYASSLCPSLQEF